MSLLSPCRRSSFQDQASSQHHHLGQLSDNSCLFPKLHLTGDSFTDFPFQIIEVLYDPALVDEPAKPVGTMAVREMKMIPDEVGVICLALLGLSANVEVGDSHGIGVQSPQRNVFLFH